MQMKTLHRRIGMYFGILSLADNQLTPAYPIKNNKVYHFITKPFYEESAIIYIEQVLSSSQISNIYVNRKPHLKKNWVLQTLHQALRLIQMIEFDPRN